MDEEKMEYFHHIKSVTKQNITKKKSHWDICTSIHAYSYQNKQTNKKKNGKLALINNWIVIRKILRRCRERES